MLLIRTIMLTYFINIKKGTREVEDYLVTGTELKHLYFVTKQKPSLLLWKGAESK